MPWKTPPNRSGYGPWHQDDSVEGLKIRWRWRQAGNYANAARPIADLRITALIPGAMTKKRLQRMDFRRYYWEHVSRDWQIPDDI